MIRVLYIGQCELGSTSRMRFEKIQHYFSSEIDLIDITPIINNTNKIMRSIGWRFKIGPLIRNINKEIEDSIKCKDEKYDLIWVDKGVFIMPHIIKKFSEISKILVHFTPDPAFFYHQSRLFNSSIKYFDACITTKSFELDAYNAMGSQSCHYVTQGFDKNIHRPLVDFSNKKYEVCFIGHYEKERAKLIQLLLDNNIEVALAGIKWKRFVKKNKIKKLIYFGSHVAGDEYVRLISSSKLGLGLLSKWIPELHTTRTFEIPACGTCLLTEENKEINEFFTDNECIKYKNDADCLNKIKIILSNMNNLKDITDRGYKRVHIDRRDYESQIFDLFNVIVRL